MNKLMSSVGVLALSAAGLNAAYAPGLSSMETTKPWSVSASLRGFYDDNYTTSPNAVAPESFGFELSPSASLNLPMDQTYVGLSYVYSMKYYEDRINNSADHSHQVNGKFDHQFSERYKLELSDSFAIAQEPTILSPSTFGVIPLRINGNNLRNYGMARFTGQISPLLSADVGYENTLFDYEQRGTNSYSAALDRMEHLISANLRYQIMPQTVGVLGYQYGMVDHTGSGIDKLTVLTLAGPVNVSPSIKDLRSHYAYIGADHNFNSQLNGSIRVGGRFTEFYNQGTDTVSPYADGSLAYAYAPGSSVQVGVRHDRNQTDITAAAVGTPTLDQESTSTYVSVSHQITASITGNFLGQYQHSTFEGGPYDGKSDDFFILGASVSYKINPHLMAEGGYNFDRLDSGVPTGGRSYTRNRVFIGLRATY